VFANNRPIMVMQAPSNAYDAPTDCIVKPTVGAATSVAVYGTAVSAGQVGTVLRYNADRMQPIYRHHSLWSTSSMQLISHILPY